MKGKQLEKSYHIQIGHWVKIRQYGLKFVKWVQLGPIGSKWIIVTKLIGNTGNLLLRKAIKLTNKMLLPVLSRVRVGLVGMFICFRQNHGPFDLLDYKTLHCSGHSGLCYR